MPETTFKFESGQVAFELAGPEAFVRENLPLFLPFVRRATRAQAGSAPTQAPAPSATPAAAAPAAGNGDGGEGGLKEWYERHVPPGTRLTMQDHILVFALWMRGFKKFVFTSDDIRRSFREIGSEPPKSLLQILGTLKRDHNLILGTERRGEYMLNTTGIERARSRLGLPSGN